jgi:hypothetical protein
MDDVTILVSTCDGYHAAWVPFCHGMAKYWPDRPWPLRFTTNFLDPPCGTAIRTGVDEGWGQMMLKGLEAVGSPVILLMMEDAWLCDMVDTASLGEFADILSRGEADHIRLCPPGQEGRPPKNDFHSDPRLFVFADDETYRTSLHAAFWRVDALKALISPGDGPWRFELSGNARTRGSDRFLCVKEMRCLRYVTSGSVIRGGEWTEIARKYALSEGLELDASRRPGEDSIYRGRFGWA